MPRRRAASPALYRPKGFAADATEDLEAAARTADIVTTATLSAEPVVTGAWLKPGAHLDLVGAYTPKMRETDDESVRRGRVYVDTRAGAMKEAGDIVLPLASGVLKEVIGDLFELTRGEVKGAGPRTRSPCSNPWARRSRISPPPSSPSSITRPNITRQRGIR